MSNPPIKVRGVKATLPPGYLLGRIASGSGETQLIPIAQIVSAAVSQAVAQVLTILTTQKSLGPQGIILLDGQDGDDGLTIPGPPGPQGPQGPAGIPGQDGEDSLNGLSISGAI